MICESTISLWLSDTTPPGAVRARILKLLDQLSFVQLTKSKKGFYLLSTPSSDAHLYLVKESQRHSETNPRIVAATAAQEWCIDAFCNRPQDKLLHVLMYEEVNNADCVGVPDMARSLRIPVLSAIYPSLENCMVSSPKNQRSTIYGHEASSTVSLLAWSMLSSGGNIYIAFIDVAIRLFRSIRADTGDDLFRRYFCYLRDYINPDLKTLARWETRFLTLEAPLRTNLTSVAMPHTSEYANAAHNLQLLIGGWRDCCPALSIFPMHWLCNNLAISVSTEMFLAFCIDKLMETDNASGV